MSLVLLVVALILVALALRSFIDRETVRNFIKLGKLGLVLLAVLALFALAVLGRWLST